MELRGGSAAVAKSIGPISVMGFGAFLIGQPGVALQPVQPKPSSSAVLADGLRLWRKPGAIQNGAACATCHSPDGIEIAAYAFDDADIRRRALPHLGDAGADAMVAYIHALRDEFHFTHLRDPESDRPLQPGGQVLPGADAVARDDAFGDELKYKLPFLFNGRIETLAQAKAAEKQLLAIDVTNLRVGIPFNRISEDYVHGSEHSSIAQWFPELPPAVPPASLDAWYAAEDAYLANPSAATLHAMLDLYRQQVNSARMMGLSILSVAKFRALLVLQDRLRRHLEAMPAYITSDVSAFPHFNPIWEVGEVTRDFMGKGPYVMGLDPELRERKLAGPAFEDQMHQMRAAWFWAGWLSDQGLFRTSTGSKTKLGLWFSQSMEYDGPYAFHDMFANARRQAVVSNNPDSWGENEDRKRRIWDFAGMRTLQTYYVDMPKSEPYRSMYTTFVANCFRMNLLFLRDDLQRTQQVWVRRNTEANVDQFVRFIEYHDPADRTAIANLQRDIDSLAENAQERI